MRRRETRVVVIGAGIGGLTAAALLAKEGYDVTVLEAHVDPGGCAATYFYRGYRFDAGATLVGGFQPGGPHDLLARALGIKWPVRRAEPALLFHTPDGSITRWSEPEAWRAERLHAFGPRAEAFWQSQEWVADQVWRFAASLPPFPPERPGDVAALARRGLRQPALLALAPFLPATAGQWMRAAGATGSLLQSFVDAQLLISAQSAARDATALFAAVALDLARAGVYHVQGGVGGIAETLADYVRNAGGRVIYRAKVTRLETVGARVTRIHTGRRGDFEAEMVLANLTPWNILGLLGQDAPAAMRERVRQLPAQWGAFTLYLGVDEELIPEGYAAHHQLVQQPALPLGEGNSLFLSISPSWDRGRAPAGQRAITISTHTRVAPWWRLYHDPHGREVYEERVARYSETLLGAAAHLLPGIRRKLRLCLPGTPITFQRFTHRHQGFVGGFPQRSLWVSSSPRLPLSNLWMVGDSIFPGQSTAGVTLGALRVVANLLPLARASAGGA